MQSGSKCPDHISAPCAACAVAMTRAQSRSGAVIGASLSLTGAAAAYGATRRAGLQAAYLGGDVA